MREKRVVLFSVQNNKLIIRLFHEIYTFAHLSDTSGLFPDGQGLSGLPARRSETKPNGSKPGFFMLKKSWRMCCLSRFFGKITTLCNVQHRSRFHAVFLPAA